MNKIPKLLELVWNIGRNIRTPLSGKRAIYAATLAIALVVLPWPARALIINVTYDSTVTSDPDSAQIQAAYNLVVQNFETLYTNPITINIIVTWGTSPFGQSSTLAYEGFAFSDVTTALQNAETTPEDRTAVASLPASDPTAGNDWAIPTAELRIFPTLAAEVGLDPNGTANDGTVKFASLSADNINWTFNPTNRASNGFPGYYDFMAVAEHETSEVMGRISSLDVGFSGQYVPYDLFRFKGGARSLNSSDTGVYFSINNGVTLLKPYNSVAGGDVQDWMPTNLVDSYDWQLANNKEGYLSSADLTALDILGYALNFHPPKLKGTRLANGNFDLTFTNVTGMGFTVWASTNILTPPTNWVNLGTPSETAVGKYQFIDTSANKNRFYRVLLQ